MSSTPLAPTLTGRCSFAAELRGDPYPGTAAPATGMLLIEQPGPWGRRALVQSRLDPRIGEAVGARAVARGMRVLLIRRPGRRAATAQRAWALADCTPGRECISWGTFTDPAELLDLPLDGTSGEPSDEPCYLICTHGRHDACCAIRGRPVARSLERARPGQVWECSHLGGDRFAANLVALPHGLYYGRVDDGTALEVVEAHERGEVDLRTLRGRSTFASAAQAAQHHVRQRLGELAINALTPVRVVALHHARWEVHLDHAGERLVVTLHTDAAGPAAMLTCAATHAAHPPVFVIEDVRSQPA